VKFSFIAKHRGIWAVDWMCEALGVSRGGFYAWPTRPRSQRSRSDEELGAKVRTSFLASDRTYGARRVWRDLLADGLSAPDNGVETPLFADLDPPQTFALRADEILGAADGVKIWASAASVASS